MMKNRYLDDIGIKTKKKHVIGGGTAKDSKRFKKQRKKYGFDGRECYALNFAAAAWLYSHLERYKKDASKIVNLDYYSFDIPVLYRTDKTSYKETEKTWYEAKRESHTQIECINLCISYLKDYLLCEKDLTGILEEDGNKEQKGQEKGKCAFQIFAEIFPMMWW